MNLSFDADTVSSLAEMLAEHVGEVHLVPAAHLSLWLPELRMPDRWKETSPDGVVTRMLRRRIRDEARWDACEVINIYRVAGAIPDSLVHEQVARSLRDSGAHAIRSQPVDIPLQYNVIAAQATGLLSLGDDILHSQYTDYAVNTAAGSALIEQIILVVGGSLSVLKDELAALSTGLQRALLASIDRTHLSPARAEIRTSDPSLGES
ncbi:hypothetical protein [Mycobacterium sp. DL592]|uniref:hypothetical protein n=1 Tax=Mycobacterium sp. DL592 TaxID=2675524 RepID=UPI001FB8BB6D|nr:hypothetical protein [Mycobacterium sp. DL592]